MRFISTLYSGEDELSFFSMTTFTAINITVINAITAAMSLSKLFISALPAVALAPDSKYSFGIFRVFFYLLS